VWDVKQASRLVVTALEKRIVPTIYLEQGARAAGITGSCGGCAPHHRAARR
jgi:hypothetical protein